MKRTLLFFLLCMGIILLSHSQATTENAITKYVTEYPNVVRKNFLYEGSSLSVSANEQDLFIQLYIAHPELLMRMIMQGGTIYIDPTGKKREKYAVILPSAKDIKDLMGDFMPTPPTGNAVNDSLINSERPNVQPVIIAMSMHGATFDINGEERLLYDDNFNMLLDEENDAIIYNILLPRTALNVRKPSANWAFGLYLDIEDAPLPPIHSQPGMGKAGSMMGGSARMQIQGPGMRPQHREIRPTGNRQPQQKSGNDNDNSLQVIMTEEVEEWIFFSIDEISCINSK